jgi:NADH dehydrogenase
VKRVLVTGAAGVMGSRLVRLLAPDWHVRGLVLPNDPLRARIADVCEIVEGDLADPAALDRACAGVELVYHLAAVILSPDPTVFARVNRDGTANVVAAAARAGVRHLVYVSSASVIYPRRTLYAESKLAAEELVKRAGIPFTIVRPTLVYDERGGQEFRLFLDYLRRFPVVPFVGPGHARKRPVFSGDVVDGLAHIAGNARAHGKTYNLSGGEAIAIGELARLMLEHHGQRKKFLHLPVPLCRAVAAGMGAFLADPPLNHYTIAGMINDADLDPREATEDLGYRPIGVRAGFARCFGQRSPT